MKIQQKCFLRRDEAIEKHAKLIYLEKCNGTCLEDEVQGCHDPLLYATQTKDQNLHKTYWHVHAWEFPSIPEVCCVRYF